MPQLTSTQRAYIRRRSKFHEPDPSELSTELNIVPFLDIIMNILIFVLATVAVTFTATIDTTPPASKSSGVRAEDPSEALNLTVLIVNDGFSLKAAGGNIAPGCQGPGAGIAIPLKNGKYDLEALTACASRLKKASPDFADENQVYITGNFGTDYQTIIDVIDALRADPQGEALFENVNFKVPK